MQVQHHVKKVMTQSKKSNKIVFANNIMRKDFGTMSHYHHLSMEEREKILVKRTENQSVRSIAKDLGRSPATISREIKRNKCAKSAYSAVAAQTKYQKRRKNSRRKKLLENETLNAIVKRLFLEEQWSPEQIAARLTHEDSPFCISYNTIYRGIYAGMFDTEKQKRSQGNRGSKRKLRHRGKTRRKKGAVETRGKIVISNHLDQRPLEANERQVIGHWEADTLLGKRGAACLVTMVDRHSRYLLAEKISRRTSQPLAEKVITLFAHMPAE